MKKSGWMIVFFLLLLLVFPRGALATTTVTSMSDNLASYPNHQVPTYKKFELTFQISRSFPGLPASDNPPDKDVPEAFLPYYYYDPGAGGYAADGITINAHFIHQQTGMTQIVPAFYYQDYNYSPPATMTPTQNYSWKVRFSPSRAGNYSYYLTIEDKNGSFTSETHNFSASQSDNKGFIQVSQSDPRFLEFNNGESFIPIGSGHQYWKCCGYRASDFINTFADYQANGINFVRIWDQNDSYNLTVEGHFDQYVYPDDYKPLDTGQVDTIKLGTQMNQRGNYEEDLIIKAAEENGVYIQLCSHGDPYWIWDASVYGPPDGTGTELNDPKHINYWKRNYRYRIARWGYSTAIFAWEAWNEHYPSGGSTQEMNKYLSFYQQWSDYLYQKDPYHHLITTSLGSQSYYPDLWALNNINVANYHDYMMTAGGRYSQQFVNDEVNFVSSIIWDLTSSTHKPWVWGELDVGTTQWNETNPKTKSGGARIRMLHNTTWAGLFSPMGTSPLDWYWDLEDSATTQARYADRKATAAFFKGIDYDGGRFTYLTSGYGGESISPVSGSNDRVFGMRREDRKAMYLWIVDAASTWSNCSVSGTSCSDKPSVATNIFVSGLNNENYKIEVWNTHSGQIISTNTANGPSFNLPAVSGLTEDAAVKIISTSLPASPPASSAPSCSNPADINCDSQVNNIDALTVLTAWFGQGTQANNFREDIHGDNKVNGMDFGWLIKDW